MPLFHYLLPLRNPLGFGAADLVEVAVAILLIAIWLLRSHLEALSRRLAARTGLCLVLLAILPVALRLALLPHFPVPTPTGSDDFSHLLVADTVAHLRLANPTHPFHRFFEAIFVLQEPSYSSMYPPGQGLLLAAGKAIFGHPWAGVLLGSAAFSGLCYWMLLAWTTPAWALAGALLAIFQFGPLCQWMNTYWTSTLPAIAGCLVFGALPRRNGPILGLGLAIHLVTRPFEFLLLSCAVILYLPFIPWRQVVRLAVPVCLILAPAIALLLFQNRAVTGSWTTLPYVLAREQYGIPATFVFQPNPIPHRQLTPEQDLNYRAQAAIHGETPESPKLFLDRLLYRVRYYRFFFLPPLYIAFLVFLATLRERRFLWVLAVLLVFGLGTNLYPYLYPHYIGAVACLFVLTSVVGLSKLRRWDTGRLILALCAVHFLFWYGIRLSGRNDLLAATTYESWDFVNHGDPEGRVAINHQLDAAPGKQLVFVHYAPNHRFHEWIHNAADIDAARVVWAGDLGDRDNLNLIHYYPDRQVWLVEPDAQPPRLAPYHPQTPTPAEPVSSPPGERKASPKNVNPFIEVPR